MAYVPPWGVHQKMAECEAFLDRCLEHVSVAFLRRDFISARDMAAQGIEYATQNESLLTPTARNLWAHLYHRRGLTQDDVFAGSTYLDKALLVVKQPDNVLIGMIVNWFHSFLVPRFMAELDRCRHKTEKPLLPVTCYLEKLTHLQTLRSIGDAAMRDSHLALSTQCCTLAKLLWKHNPNFPKQAAIVQLFEEHAAICMKRELWNQARADVEEVLGYGETPSSSFFCLAARVEIKKPGQQNQEFTLKRYQSALSYIVDGLKVYPSDPDLIKMKTCLEEEIRRLQRPSTSRPTYRTPRPDPTVNLKPPPLFSRLSEDSVPSSGSFDSVQTSPAFSRDMEHEKQCDLPVPAEPTEKQCDLPVPAESTDNTEKAITESPKGKKKKKSKSATKKRRGKRKTKLIPRERNTQIKAPESQCVRNENVNSDGKPRVPKVSSETAIRVHHKPACGGGKQKKTAKRNESKASSVLYADLNAQYCIKYGCDACTNVTNHTVEVKVVAHGCAATKLLLQERSNPLMNFILVRPCPQRYIPTEDPEDLCEHFQNGEECREKARCPKPHSKVEKMLWDKYFRKKIGFSKFMMDIQNSPLRVKNELSRICLRYSGRYAFICKRCFRKDKGKSNKKSHKPECFQGHAWNENQLLVFEKTKGAREVIILDQENPSDETEEIQKCLQELIKSGFSEDEIVYESVALNQRQNALARNAGKSKKAKKWKKYDDRRKEADDEETRWAEETYDDTEVDYDCDLEDIMTVWDSDEECEEQLEENQPSSENSYYAMQSEYELLKLLRDDPRKYKHCNIHLDRHFAAKCKVLEKNPGDNIREIEIRGRMNCGPTFDGDEVVVEVKSVEVLDSREEKVSFEYMPNDEETVLREEAMKSAKSKREAKIETRGVVRGIVRKTLNRKAYTFLCRADRYLCHLMKPLNGIAPKIHVTRNDKSNDRVFIYQMQDGVLHCTKVVKLDPIKRNSMLFVVRYLKWDPANMYPLGYVTHVIRAGETIEQSQQVINILHQVPTKPNPACEEIASKMDVYIPADRNWRDLRKLFVVSIDPPNCKDVDDALSVEKVKEDEFRVGVHIADVSHYVDQDDVIDKNARRRATSYYAATGKVYGMLPARLSEEICSLREGKERLVLSVFFHITIQKGVIGKPEICRSVIINRKQLTYAEAETYIDQIGTRSAKWQENDIECVISYLQLIAVRLRESRTREGQFFYKSDKPFEMDYPYEAHRMVEEFMILTNRYIGSFLEATYPGCIPLRLQDPPNEEDLDKWKERNSPTASNAFYFRQYSTLLPKIEPTTEGGNVSVLMHILERILSAVEADDFKKIKTLIGSEDFHPLHLLAMVSWYKIQEKATFGCTTDEQSQGQVPKSAGKTKEAPENQNASDSCSSNANIVVGRKNSKRTEGKIGHFSLQLEHYAQFTSPIRRFMDIVIHRFVKTALDREPAPYTHDEVQSICKSTNQIAVRGKKYDKACQQLKATVLLQEPFRIPFVVENFDGNSINLTSPYLPHLRRGQRPISYSDLQVSQKPELKEKEVNLSWERRFYDERVSFSIARTTAQTKEVLELDSERNSAQADPVTWNNLQRALMQRNLQQLRLIINTLVDKDKLRKQGLCQRLEITSEMKPDHLLVKHHVKFRQSLRRGTVLLIQVGAECLTGGYLHPICQMLQLTNEKDICLQHGRDPVACFAKVATEKVATRYESIEHYKRVWLPIITMEAATQAAAAGDAIVCNNVPIEFLSRNGRCYGTLRLPLDFCRKRQIKIYIAEDEDDDSNDYMCIRYSVPSPSRSATSDSSPVRNKVWVAHVVSTKSTTKKADVGEATSREDSGSQRKIRRQMVYLDFIVQHQNGPIPSELLLEEDAKLCTVEFLTKSLPDRRMEGAVTAIDEASELCISIVLKTRISQDSDIDMPESVNYDIETDDPKVPRNNRTQIKAIKMALKNPFTVIQGPPGTGKTVTGVKLIYWFAKANERLRAGQARPQILYCGPSNSAVDVAASLLKKFLGAKRDLKVVRVYSDMLEKQVYPIPRDASQMCLQTGRRYDKTKSDEHRDIALHHLIRKPHNSHSEKLKEFDEKFARFSRSPERVPDKDVDDYLRLATTACIEELPRYDVIFCTCSASSSKKMQLGTMIRQIIIDECGMCMEPESLVPLVCYKDARQIVLIGDHKQLQPIITNSNAKDLGMQKSLFERYEDKAIMLDEQYRMHPSICEFPSQMFYESRLRTAVQLANRLLYVPPIWPSENHPCIVFIHVEGAEQTLSVSTEEGNQQSKSNKAERDEAIRIFTKLVNNRGVREDKIVVLSQYKAQCSEIEKNLNLIGFRNPRVSTVVASQGGEWQYVILSLVRSLPEYEIERSPSEGWCKRNMGFITDQHQINVALTRAKIGLIIIGNKHLLRCDKMWRKLLEYYDKRRCIVGVTEFLPEFVQMHRSNARTVH